ncbi:MAG: SRPBCC domain-containing protein [Vicinamibacterales bacterium]
MTIGRSTDRIVKSTLLHAPLARVWAAVSDSQKFGAWFGAEFDGPFVGGTRLTGRIRPIVDPEVAKLQNPHSGTAFTLLSTASADALAFAFRWHPYAVGDVDVSNEPMTLVTFGVASTTDGTTLTITESGFDAIPLERRAAAFAANDSGWTHQLRLVAKYLAMGDHR